MRRWRSRCGDDPVTAHALTELAGPPTFAVVSMRRTTRPALGRNTTCCRVTDTFAHGVGPQPSCVGNSLSLRISVCAGRPLVARANLVTAWPLVASGAGLVYLPATSEGWPQHCYDSLPRRAHATEWRFAKSKPRGGTVDHKSRCDHSMKRTNIRDICARLVIWIATGIFMMIDRSLQLPQELDEI
jgi:hypothetical protein